MTPVLMAAILAILLALFFDFTNGAHDAANNIAGVIKTNALKPKTAIIITVTCVFCGAYFLGTNVAETLGKGLVDPSRLETGVSGTLVIMSALCGAIIWNLFTLFRSIPSSSSHALLGGLIGAFVAGWGLAPVNWLKVGQIFAILILSPVFCFGISWCLTRLLFSLCDLFGVTPGFNNVLRTVQRVTVFLQSLAHGANDAQKTMGVVVFILIIAGLYVPVEGRAFIPQWVILLCSATMAAGIACGGWNIVKTVGSGFYDLKPIHATSSQLCSAMCIYSASVFGIPVSSSQMIGASAIGSGASEKSRNVHWDKGIEMAEAWLYTLPASAMLASVFLFSLTGRWMELAKVLVAGTALILLIMLFRILLPRMLFGGNRKEFKELLLEQIDAVIYGVNLAVAYCNTPTRENAVAVDTAEKEADQARRVIAGEIYKRFVTGKILPHDIDIFSNRIDSIMDELKKAVIRMSKFDIVPDESITLEVSEILEAVKLLREAIVLFDKDVIASRARIEQACKRENQVVHIAEKWFCASRPDFSRRDQAVTSEEKYSAMWKVLAQAYRQWDNWHGHFALQVAAAKVVEAAEKFLKILDQVS